MNPYTADEIGKLILRLSLSILILFHGVSKLIGGIDPLQSMLQEIGLPAFMAFGVFLGEVVGPILLLIGWYARIGAGLIIINMIFAILLAHRQEFFTLTPQGGWALELQGMFLLTALALVFTGPGRISLNTR